MWDVKKEGAVNKNLHTVNFIAGDCPAADITNAGVNTA